MDTVLLSAVKAYLVVPSLIMNVFYGMGPVVAPVLLFLVTCSFPFIALRDKKEV